MGGSGEGPAQVTGPVLGSSASGLEGARHPTQAGAPATGTGHAGRGPSSGRCTGQGSTCQRTTVRDAWGPQAACVNPGCTISGEQGTDRHG